MNTPRSLIAAAATASALTFALAACGSSGTASTSTTQSSTAGSPGSSATTSTFVIKTAANPALGTILVDGQGRTLYRFDADSSTPPTSNCLGTCATYWPPLKATAGEQVQGVSSALLGTITRSDGTKQVTFDGWPLYTYAGDSTAGATTGQGLNASGGLWWAVTTSGARAHAGAQSSTGSTGSSGAGGY